MCRTSKQTWKLQGKCVFLLFKVALWGELVVFRVGVEDACMAFRVCVKTSPWTLWSVLKAFEEPILSLLLGLKM